MPSSCSILRRSASAFAINRVAILLAVLGSGIVVDGTMLLLLLLILLRHLLLVLVLHLFVHLHLRHLPRTMHRCNGSLLRLAGQ